MWNPVDHEKFIQIVKESGIRKKRQVAFTKIFGTNDRRIYVKNTQKVSVVHLYGFEIKGPGFVLLREPRGRVGPKVQQELDFSLSEQKVLDAFRRAIDRIRS